MVSEYGCNLACANQPFDPAEDRHMHLVGIWPVPNTRCSLPKTLCSLRPSSLPLPACRMMIGSSCLRTDPCPLLGHISLVAPGSNLSDATAPRCRDAWSAGAKALLVSANPGIKKPIPCWMRSTQGTPLPTQGIGHTTQRSRSFSSTWRKMRLHHIGV